MVYEDSTSYVFFSDNDEVKSNDTSEVQFEDYISVPQIDIEQSVRALCLAKDGKSSAIYSPIYESKYLPYPIIISARKILYGAGNSKYLVIGSKAQWRTVLKNVYCHGNLGNHPLSRDYGFRDILNIKTKDECPKQKSYKFVRWVLSGFFNSDLWDEIRDVALIIVDMVTDNSPKLDKTDIEAILSYSNRSATPVVFFIKGYNDNLAEYLKENGVEILTPIADIPTTAFFKPQVYSHHTHDEELSTFLTDYNLRSYKINKNGLKKVIEIRIIEDNKCFSNVYQKYLELTSSLRMSDSNSYGRHVYFLARTFYDSLMEFTGNVNANINGRFEWLTHPIGVNRARFYDAIWNLSDTSQTLAKELIEEADSIIKNFETKKTPKGESLSEILTSYQDQNKTIVLLGKQSAMDGFFRNTFPERASSFERYLVAPDQLENAHLSDIMILLNPVYGRDKTKLLTSCSSKIIILNYPWQTSVTEKSIKDIKEFSSGERFSSREIDSGTDDNRDDSIEVSVIGAINQTNHNKEEVPIETAEKTPIGDFWFNESSDLFEDEPEEDTDEDLPYLNAILDNNDSYEIPKWMVSIENREVVIPENRKIVLVNDQKTYLVKVSKLRPGDRILITKDFNPKSLSDFVWEIMERRFGIMRKTHPGNEWREKLKDYMMEHPGITYPQLFEKLKQMGGVGIETPAAIYLWLESYDIIGPHDFETLEAIAKLVNSEDRSREWWEGIKFIRMRHRRMIRHLWKIFTYSAKELKEKNEEDYVVDTVLGIKISDISKLVRFATVTGTPRKVENHS
jgi:hypothetical protein